MEEQEKTSDVEKDLTNLFSLLQKNRFDYRGIEILQIAEFADYLIFRSKEVIISQLKKMNMNFDKKLTSVDLEIVYNYALDKYISSIKK